MGLQIIPNISENSTAGERYIKDKLTKIYRDKNAILYIKPKIKNLEPDFILIDPLKGVCILEVKDWTKDYITEINNVEVRSKDGKKLYNPTFRTRQYHNLVKGVFEGETSLFDFKTGELKFNIYSKVLYPNMTIEEIDSFGDFLKGYPILSIGKEILKKWEIDDIFSTDNYILDNYILEKLRGLLFPEIKVFESSYENKNMKIDRIIKVLDLEQESFARRISAGNYMVSGIPGSGKTVILLARALHLLKENIGWKIKIVTYNRSLKSKIENKINKFRRELIFNEINLNNLSISTFHQMAKDISKLTIPSYPNSVFWEEELPNKAIERAYPMYDAVLIDEYQDFRDNWLELCVKITKEDTDGKKSIFLAGDRLQSIYNPKDITWKNLGINIQGRSKLLKHAYRSGKKHIELALEFLKKDKILEEEVNKFYEGTEDIESENYGDEIGFIKEEEEINTLLTTFLKRLDYNPEDILILTPTISRAYELHKKLPTSISEISEVSKDIQSDKLIITTYHSSKGLEGKICILIDFDKVLERKLAYVGMTRAS